MAVNPKVPSQQMPVVDPGTGLATQTWFQFFGLLLGQPNAIQNVPSSGATVNYTAGQNGYLVVPEGAASDIELKRSSMTIPTGMTSGMIPLSQGDTAIVSLTGNAQLSFVPR
jgi:hypothetical protein